ncbi:sensor histidine kinase [Flavobacterium dankookense]|uniref:histidine kinase n=1 Tax=Flavobacterium dankookense TaxID=706186 RepID=A0A4R6QGG0_9FLAO|nr:sensor histidine kinase [Flavobacterium dankookense]TDP61136.1 two-component sensor histidine kinase [Flavobacterium dankookense]
MKRDHNELNHRIKNNLQLVVSILNIQAKESRSNEVKSELELGQKRVVSIMLMHESIDFHYKENIVDMDMYIYKIYSYLKEAYDVKDEDSFLQLNANNIKLKMDLALPLGLIINEFLLSSLLNSKISNLNVSILLEYDEIRANYLLSFSDDSIYENLERKEDNLGIEMVKILLKQIKAKITAQSTYNTFYQIEFPKE